MTQFHCNVTSCVSNKEGGCCLNTIKVEGPAAKQSSETVCGSYQKKGMAQNSAAYDCAHYRMDVGCSARECCYNKNDHCTSDEVTIACNCGCGERSECATFRI